MDELQTLQSRVDAILRVPHSRPPVHTAQSFTEKVAATPPTSFSPFDPAQAQQANMLARRFVRLANSAEGTAGLQAVLDEAEKAGAIENPELVRYALMLFITHHPKGNQLKIKPLEKRAPQLVLPSKQPAVPLRVEARVAKTAMVEATEATTTMVEATFAEARVTAAVTPSEALLNWFREDPKANEHHEHWHLVYPFTGDPVTGMTRDRQGELFLYMHEQMIAAQKNMAARDITIRLVDAVPG